MASWKYESKFYFIFCKKCSTVIETNSKQQKVNPMRRVEIRDSTVIFVHLSDALITVDLKYVVKTPTLTNIQYKFRNDENEENLKK